MHAAQAAGATSFIARKRAQSLIMVMAIITMMAMMIMIMVRSMRCKQMRAHACMHACIAACTSRACDAKQRVHAHAVTQSVRECEHLARMHMHAYMLLLASLSRGEISREALLDLAGSAA